MSAARPTSKVRRERKEQSSPREQRRELSEKIPPETLLAAWTAVFPLSQGPAHRVRLRSGPNADADLIAAIVADYVGELSQRVESGCRVGADGNLYGPRDFDGTPHDDLFTAVFTTDLDAIVARH